MNSFDFIKNFSIFAKLGGILEFPLLQYRRTFVLVAFQKRKGDDIIATKKSFVIYHDWEEALFSLSDEDRLEIYDAIFLYSKYSEKPEFKSDIVIPLFYMFKNTLDRDSKKYEQVCERNKSNGEKGGRPQKNKEKNIDKNPVGFSETQENLLKPKKPDNDNDNVNDNVNDNDNKNEKNISTSSFSSKKVYSDLFSEFWSLYPKKIGKGGANKVFERLKLNNDDLLQIKNALKWQKQSEQWQKNGGQFIPNPSTYLSQRRWEDEPFEASTPDFTNPDRYEEVYNNDLPF